MSRLDQNHGQVPPRAPVEGATGCFLLLASPADRLVQECFRALGVTWSHCLSREQLWLEGEVLLAPNFAQHLAPQAIQRVLTAECSLIAKIEIQLAGLTIRFVRSGGHAPFKQSFFDELHLEPEEHLDLSEAELRQILLQITQWLHVVNVRGSELFTTLLEQLG